MKHAGILAHSADGASLCFLEMCREGERVLGSHQHPEITLSIQPMGEALPAWERMDLAFLRDYLAQTAARLAAAGCDFFLCPDNTAHLALEAVGKPALPLPGLHIAELVAERARSEGRRRLGLLGTSWTMEGPTYRDACARRGIDVLTPPPEERTLVNRIIFDELCRGILADESRAAYLRVIEGLQQRGCDAVALSCTEIPLLVTPEVSPLPTLDSTRLLARAAVAVAAGLAPMPVWRGGPLTAPADA